MNEPDLDSLFEEEFSWPSMIRCKCGSLVQIDMPGVCPKCQDQKAFWRTIDGKILPLSKMDLGHLNNTVRMLARKAEQYPHGDYRTRIEIAMDLFYLEIGTRVDEIEQVTGIMSALTRSLDKA